MSENECLNADWRLIGHDDGQSGKPRSILGAYRKDCAQYGVTPNQHEYEEGRDQGLTFYCTRDNGYRVGRSNPVYKGVCPAVLEIDFQNGYEMGRSVNRAVSRVERVNSLIRYTRRDMVDLEDEIRELQREVQSDQLSREESAVKQDRIASMNRQIGRLEGKLEGFIHDRVLLILEYREVVKTAQSEGFYEPMRY
ncbi:MAG: DUF2799 domain-containing protein [Halieaceae bacterium]|nr:DUF2799 domain-containing protein [Halieaceae bacterium]